MLSADADSEFYEKISLHLLLLEYVLSLTHRQGSLLTMTPASLRPQRVLHLVLTSRIILHLRVASFNAHEDIDTIPPLTFNQPGASCNVETTATAFSGDLYT